MRFRRLFILQLSMICIFVLLVVRLFWVQSGIFGSFGTRQAHVIVNSVTQRKQELILDTGRGHFYDRKQRPLTGDTYWTVAIFPMQLNRTTVEKDLRTLSQELENKEIWTAEHLKAIMNRTEPFYWLSTDQKTPIRIRDTVAKRLRQLHFSGIEVVPYTARYFPHAPAAQLLGYLGQNPQRIEAEYSQALQQGSISISTPIGGAGLEKAFDRYLHSKEATSLAYFMDAKNRLLHGMQLRLRTPQSSYSPVQVHTTLDVTLQTKVDAYLEKKGLKQGAVVVLDASNADVLAMSSRPRFEPYAINMERNEWANMALKAQIPGSIFKTVVAAAALEHKHVTLDELFYCNGSLGKYGLNCWKQGGHGKLTMEQAFAHSCNVVFAKLAERVSSMELEEMASRLGLLAPIGWAEQSVTAAFRQFDAEEAGRVFMQGVAKDDGGVKAQTSIGQRDVRITPLAAANLVVTLLNDGIVTAPRVVSHLSYRNGVIARQYRTQTKGRALSPHVASLIKHWMRSTVIEGTARSLRHHSWKLAGKTGTGEVQKAMGWGENEWFIGYGPAEQPRFVISVLVQKETADAAHQAVEVFGDIMEIIASHDELFEKNA